MSAPFSEAPVWWDKGFSVIPLEPETKQPARWLKQWPSYCTTLPNTTTRERWHGSSPHFGLGLCLGTVMAPGFRIAAIDVDRDYLTRAVTAIVGQDISSKRGAKGLTLFVLIREDSKIKSTVINDHEKRGVIDLLSVGKMTVLPPSIHPDTGRPYEWVSRSLLDIDVPKLPILDEQKLMLLRLVTGSEHTIALSQGRTTHDPGMRFVAQLVAGGCDDATIVELFTAILPNDYAGNSLQEIGEWIRSAREKGYGEPKEGKRKSPADVLLELVDHSGAELFHDEAKRGYLSVPAEHRMRHFPIRSSDGKMWLTQLYYESKRKAISDRPLEAAIALLEARARFDAPRHVTFLRVGGTEQRTIVDLGGPDARAVTITKSGWSIEGSKLTKLIRSPGLRELPLPERGGDLHRLATLLGLDDESWTLVLAFLLCCLRPTGPYMLLLVEGEQGSGKSFLCKIIKSIIDPNQIEKARLPNSERDLMIHAKEFFLLVFDNVSGMKGDLSDALCTLATDGGFATRKLYTDDELYVFNFCRAVIINGIADYVQRPDLMERSIFLRLRAMPEKGRRGEREMMAEFEVALPEILGCLYTVVSKAMAAPLPDDVSVTLRMADCERWLRACEPFTGLAPGSFVRAIKSAQDEAFSERAANDAVVSELLKILQHGAFEGTVLQLLERISGGSAHDRFFPTTPAHLSKHLTRLRPAMAKAGVGFDFGAKTRAGRKIRVWLIGEEAKIAPSGQPPPAY